MRNIKHGNGGVQGSTEGGTPRTLSGGPQHQGVYRGHMGDLFFDKRKKRLLIQDGALKVQFTDF